MDNKSTLAAIANEVELESSRQGKGYLMVFLAGILWGSIGLFVKLLSSMGAGSALISFGRLLFGFLIMLIIALIWKRKKLFEIKLRTLICCALMGLFCQTIYNLSYTEAINEVGMATGAILLYAAPVFTCFFSKIVFNEYIGRKKLMALGVNIIGCVLTITGGNFTSVQFSKYGLLMGVIAAVMYALSAIIGRFATDNADPIIVAVYMFAFAIFFVSIFTRPWEGALEVMSLKLIIVAVLYALIPTVASYILYFNGLARIKESSKVPVFASVETVIAALIGVTVFSEGMNPGKIVGIMCVLSSIYIMNIGKAAVADAGDRQELNNAESIRSANGGGTE